jgi:hypothetical protein
VVALSWEARVLGRDEHGMWLYCPAGQRHRRADGTVIVADSGGVQLLPGAGWWAAWWWQRGHWIAVDVCTPPKLDGAQWSYVDLELDIVRTADDVVTVVDEDEFDELVAECALPERVVMAACAAAVEVQAALVACQEPFGRRGWDWLARIHE